MHLGTIRKDTPDILSRSARLPYSPVVPSNMILDMPRFQRSMFMDHSASYLFAITAVLPLSSKGKPVLKNIHRLSLTSSTPASWEQVFSGSALASVDVEILACTTTFSAAICAYTEHSTGMLKMFQLDIISTAVPLPFSMYWETGYNISSRMGIMFSTEVVVIPFSSSDVVVGSPLQDDVDYGTILVVFASNRSSVQLPGARGVGCFKSMAFSEDGLSLFAVDEQPGKPFCLFFTQLYIEFSSNKKCRNMEMVKKRSSSLVGAQEGGQLCASHGKLSMEDHGLDQFSYCCGSRVLSQHVVPVLSLPCWHSNTSGRLLRRNSREVLVPEWNLQCLSGFQKHVHSMHKVKPAVPWRILSNSGSGSSLQCSGF